MENRVAIVAIIVEKTESVSEINNILHEYSDSIIGRMGIPHCKNRNHSANCCNIISVVMDAPHDVISALSGKIGRLDGVSAKTVYNKSC